MIIHHDIELFKAQFPVVTVGIFDGMHIGHLYILDRLKKIAGYKGGETVVVILWPHPRTVLGKEDLNFRLLTTQAEKISLFEAYGINHLVVLPFTHEFSKLSGCEFIEKFLIGGIGMGTLVVGFNHRFGRDGEGDFSAMKNCAPRLGFEIEKMDAFLLEGSEISSSGIRKLLHEGNVIEAERLLGRAYGFSGQVVGGSRLGRSMGFPTANITLEGEDKLMPADGVYAVEVDLRNQTYQGMMNMGSRPTVNESTDRETIEVHLLAFNDEIYDENIRVRFKARIRDEQKFEGIDALKAQLEKDREETLRIFSIK